MKQVTKLALALGLTVALILLLVAALGCAPYPLTGAEGDTNLTNLVLSGDLTVGDDVTISDDLAVGGDLDVDGAADIAGNVTSASGAFTITDNVMIDGAADAIQLLVQGYTTQTNNLIVAETSAGTDKFTVDNAGNVDASGIISAEHFYSSDDATITDDLAVGGDATISGSVIPLLLSYSCEYKTTTGALNLDPAASCYVWAPSTYTTATLQITGTGYTTGTVLYIVNIGSGNLNIPDTNIRTSTGAALNVGQYDVVGWIFAGSEWVELFLSANS